MTNYERIKQMTSDDFANWLSDRYFAPDCENCIYNGTECPENRWDCIAGFIGWLKKESEQ